MPYELLVGGVIVFTCWTCGNKYNCTSPA